MREPYSELYLLAAFILPWLFIIAFLKFSTNDFVCLAGTMLGIIIGCFFWVLRSKYEKDYEY